MKIKPYTIAGIVAVVLAVAVGFSLVTFAVAAAIALDSRHLTLSDSATALLTTTIGAVIGALSTYLGISKGGEISNGSENSDEISGS